MIMASLFRYRETRDHGNLPKGIISSGYRTVYVHREKTKLNHTARSVYTLIWGHGLCVNFIHELL